MENVSNLLLDVAFDVEYSKSQEKSMIHWKREKTAKI